MRSSPEIFQKTQPLAAFALLCVATIFSPPARAAELEWTNGDDSNRGVWVTGSVLNWWDAGAGGGTGAEAVFTAGSPVVFGSGTAPGGTITISSSAAIVLAASGTNPGMIVTGPDNWEFVKQYWVSNTVSGTTVLSATNAGAGISGTGAGVLMKGTGVLTFSTTTTYTGATQVENGTLRLNVANAIEHSSRVVLSPPATLDLAGFNQSLKELSVSPGSLITLNNGGATHTTLTLGTLTGNGGIFDLHVDIASEKSDQIIITGASSGTHTLNFTFDADAEPRAGTSILVVSATAGGGAIFQSAGFTSGTFTYTVEPGANGSWYLNSDRLPDRITSAVIAVAAAAGQDWHYELDAIHKRMGELREPPFGATREAGSGNAWFRAGAARFKADKNLTGRGFTQDHYAATVGGDKAWFTDDSTWFAGVFGATARVERNFGQSGGGRTTSNGAGAYATWLHATGWFADLALRMDLNKNRITAATKDGYLTSARYNNKVTGASIEAGRRLLWNEEWWIEPSVQYATAGITGARYEAACGDGDPLAVKVRNARVAQTRFAMRLGEVAGATPGWHPYAKGALVHSRTGGGRVSVGASEHEADFDGWRWEAGIGAAYVINARCQVYYDYEYTHATRYRRPWAVSAGCRLAW